MVFINHFKLISRILSFYGFLIFKSFLKIYQNIHLNLFKYIDRWHIYIDLKINSSGGARVLLCDGEPLNLPSHQLNVFAQYIHLR